MSKLNIGDRIKVVKDQYIWLDEYGLDHDTVLTIVEDTDYEFNYVNAENLTIEIEAVHANADDFEKVEDKFFAGLGSVVENIIGEAVSIPSIQLATQASEGGGMGRGFTNISTHKGSLTSQGTAITSLGVYRPVLEDRKVGKVRVELVDKGFPNALWELAKLMTWAQEAKGYKDHDWKNLPDAKNSLPAAASRHRQKHNLEEFYDDESELHHKVSEAFGVLAELELILTGKIKL